MYMYGLLIIRRLIGEPTKASFLCSFFIIILFSLDPPLNMGAEKNPRNVYNIGGFLNMFSK
jgi:hypothetical protein